MHVCTGYMFVYRIRCFFKVQGFIIIEAFPFLYHYWVFGIRCSAKNAAQPTMFECCSYNDDVTVEVTTVPWFELLMGMFVLGKWMMWVDLLTPQKIIQVLGRQKGSPCPRGSFFKTGTVFGRVVFGNYVRTDRCFFFRIQPLKRPSCSRRNKPQLLQLKGDVCGK